MVHMKKARVGYLKKRSGRVLSGPACDQMFRMWISSRRMQCDRNYLSRRGATAGQK